MTQIKEGLIKSQAYAYADMKSEEHTLSEDKNDSKDSHMRISDKAEKVIAELNSMHGEAKNKILELIEILRIRDGLKDHEIKKVIFERVNFVSKATLYRALPQDFKKEYTKPLPKTINISTEHKVIDITPEEKEKELITAVYESQQQDEEPTELELAEIKIKHLEEALKKTEQFKPASTMELDKSPNPTDEIFEWLYKRADGTGKFYYDTYGIDLFKNRELSQLKNSGVKVFKRLYFEV